MTNKLAILAGIVFCIWTLTLTPITPKASGGGLCDWLCDTSSYEEKLEQTEKDKLWLWDQLVKCRAKLPQSPYPQPSEHRQIPGNEIKQAFRRAGVNTLNMFLADNSYKAINKIEFEGWLAHNEISEKKYIHPDMDCDDFAQQTATAAKIWFPGLAIGEIWGTRKDNPDFNHAFIAIIDINGDLIFYEPQTDSWREVEDWDVYFSKFDMRISKVSDDDASNNISMEDIVIYNNTIGTSERTGITVYGGP